MAGSAGTRRIVPRDPVLRRLSAVTLVNTFGNGLFFTLAALYFTRIVGLTVAQVGLGLTIAGALGVLGSVPFGQLADRLGILPTLIALVIAEAAGTFCFTVVGSFVSFLVVASVTTLADRAAAGVRSALYAVVLNPRRRTQGRAYLRAVTNVGIGAGSATAAVALQLDTRAAYVALILVDVATFVATAAMLLGLAIPRAPGRRAVGAPRVRNAALRDRPYLAISALNAVLALQFGLVEVGLPLWIVGHTDAPRAMVSVTLLTNTVLVVLLQVRASRGITTAESAARLAMRGGLLMALSCVLLAVADGAGTWVAAGILLVGIVTQTLSEVTTSAAGWALGYDLADPRQPGAYQGVFSTGFALAGMLAPLVVTSTALRFGFAGWCVLAIVFAGAGVALIPVTRWARSTRPEIPDPIATGTGAGAG